MFQAFFSCAILSLTLKLDNTPAADSFEKVCFSVVANVTVISTLFPINFFNSVIRKVGEAIFHVTLMVSICKLNLTKDKKNAD